MPRRYLRVGLLATILEVFWSMAHGLRNEFGRRRSFHGDCTSSHPFVDPLLCGKRSGRLGTGDPARNYSLRPSCATRLVPIRTTFVWDRSRRINGLPRTEQGPQGSWLTPRSIQSPRTLLWSRLPLPSPYQRSIQGTSNPRNWHNSTAAAQTLRPRTDDHSSKALPREPQRKQG